MNPAEWIICLHLSNSQCRRGEHKDCTTHTLEAAKKRFSKYIANPCPTKGCDADINELCDTPGVWIHYERMKLVIDKEDS